MNKGRQRRECLLSEILGRRRILLDALQVLDRQESLLSLLIDDRCELVILVLHLLDDLFFDAFLLENCVLHCGTLAKGFLCLIKQLVKLVDLQGAGLFQCHATSASTVLVEVAIVAECLIAHATIRGQLRLILTLAHADLSLGHQRLRCGLLRGRGLRHSIAHCCRVCFHHFFVSASTLALN